jgi:broad specificity phosphatase PhoE
MLIYVIRHGESEDDLSDSYGGAANFRLTDHGREQAKATAGTLIDANISVVYASPLARANESASIIATELGGLIVETINDLRERNTYGVLSGHTKTRAQELFGYLIDSLPYKPGEWPYCMPGGEEYEPFINRVRSAFEQVISKAARGGHENVAIVTHGKFSQGLFGGVLGLGDEYQKDHGSVNVIEYYAPRLNS